MLKRKSMAIMTVKLRLNRTCFKMETASSRTNFRTRNATNDRDISFVLKDVSFYGIYHKTGDIADDRLKPVTYPLLMMAHI